MSYIQKINAMTRKELITIGAKLNLKGIKNKKKEDLKKQIIDTISEIKKKRTKSQSSVTPSITKQPKPTLRRAKSLPFFNKNKSSKKNYSSKNDIIQIYDIDRCMYPKVKKLVAIGDIHGDLSVAIKSLKLAGVIDKSIPSNTRDVNNIKWTGGDIYVVQLGDQIDRVRPGKLYNNLCREDDDELCSDEGSDLKIISLFENLHKQAKKQGGALFSIFGNHELMNVDGDFRYVSPKEFREFGNFFKGKYEANSKFPFGYKERLEVFQPGGLLSKRLAMTRYSVLQIGSWVFVHGSISPQCAEKYSLKEINKHIKNWLLGQTKDKSFVNELFYTDDDEHSPFWSRIFTDLDEWQETKHCQLFNKTINNLNIKNLRNNSNVIKGMIMGHSPQFMYNKGINSACNNKIWRVDVGASRAFGPIDDSHREVQVLLIENDNKFTILNEKSL